MLGMNPSMETSRLFENPKILVVDDDPMIGRVIKRYLEEEGMDVAIASSGFEMREHLKRTAVDLVLMDLSLPGENGIALTKELRQTSEIGIIIVTGKSDKVDRVVGLEIGADDYVSKPFDERELLARIRSVLRRTQARRSDSAPEIAPQGPESGYRFNGWTLNVAARALTDAAGVPCLLTTLEFELLLAFVQAPNRVLSRDHLLDVCAGRSWDTYDRAIDTAVVKLRRKLGDESRSPTIIKTIRGVGYLFAPTVVRD